MDGYPSKFSSAMCVTLWCLGSLRSGNVVAVLEHLVRGAGVHLDEGLEKEFVIVLFFSSV